MQRRWLLPILTGIVLSLALYADGQRPLSLDDTLAWKRIQSPTLSQNGEWFAYKLAPAEGNAEVVYRNLKTGKDERLPAGDASAAAPAGGGAPTAAPPVAVGGGFAISNDSHWLAFTAYPTTDQAKQLKKNRRPIQTRAVLVELATGKKTEFEKIRRFAFSGDNSKWIALQRYGADAPAGAAPAPPAAPGAAPPAADRPTGADLLLYELATGNELNTGNVADFAFNKQGEYLAYTIDAADKAGNGVILRNMTNGATIPLDSSAAVYRSLGWTEKGDALAAVRGSDDKAFDDKLYSLVAFKDFGLTGAATKVVFDPKTQPSFPAGMTISSSRPPVWRADLTAVTFGIHEIKPKKNAGRGAPPVDDAAAPAAGGRGAPTPDEPEVADLVIWHYKDSRLATQQQVQENADKNFSYLSTYVLASKKFVRLSDDSVKQVALAAEQRYAMGTDIREYERMGNLDGKRFQDVYVIDPVTGDRKVALKHAEHVMGASPDGTKMLYYRDGIFYSYDMATGKSIDLTSKIKSTFYDRDNDVNVIKPPTPSLGWSKDSTTVLLSDGWDIWAVPADGGPPTNLTVNGTKDKVRYRRIFRLDPEERGTDLTAPFYVSVYGEWTKKGGIGRIEPGKPGVHMLQWEEAAFSQLIKAKSADVYLYTRETPVDYPNYYLTDSTLERGQKITDANPQQKDILWTAGTKLVDYTNTRGQKLQAALHLPANYQPGKKYPTIVYIYEKLSQDAFAYPQPSDSNVVHVANYTSKGYAILEPDIVYQINDPGMSAVACVVPAVKAAIATGVVDEQHVGIQGHSWGGYQTAFLVTQTNIFKAAVAGAPLTDMVSMYSLIYRNTGGSNAAIFESSQGRFAGGYWDNSEAYIRNSPAFHAKNVNTPLMMMANDKDGAVDQTQGIAFYNTLRRMDKPVILLEYKGENHNLREPKNLKDYYVRLQEFFDHYLLGAPAPKWMEEGVPIIKMKDHLEERAKTTSKSQPDKPPATPGAGGGN